MIRKILLVLSLLASPALAQNVQQSGTVTRGHLPYWVTSGVIGDGGSSVDGLITSIGVTNEGGAGFCVSSARSTAPGRNQLCFGASTAGPATISLQNYGTAVAQNLQFVLNGSTITLPTGSSSFITGTGTFSIGGIPCFVNTSGTVQDCGLTAAAGAITGGVWNGTPIAVANGGTGATSTSGARTNLGLGTISTQDSSAVAITGGTITGLPTPSNPTDAAIKSYVDATATGLNILAASTLATAAVLPNTPTYANGTLGVGATLTAGSNTTLTVDGTAAPLNTVVLVKNQASAFQNGIYTVTTAGSGAAAWVLTRATYFDQAAEMKAGSYTAITAGSTNTNTSWVLQVAVTTVGTDSLAFAQFSSATAGVSSLGGSNGIITLGSGLQMTGQVQNTASGVPTNTLNAIVANYSVATSDCGKSIQAGTGSTGFFTVTLPVVSGFAATCVVTIKNADAARGKGLSGFPAGVPTLLWPSQAISVGIVNGVWASLSVPGLWVLPVATTLYVDHALGHDDGSTDCLAPGASACATIQFGLNTIKGSWNCYLFPANIQNAIETFTESQVRSQGPACLGKFHGVEILGNDASPSSVVWQCTVFCAAASDFGSIFVSGFKFVGLATGDIALEAAQLGALGYQNIDFGTFAGGTHVKGIANGFVRFEGGTYTISGSASFHIALTTGATIGFGSPGPAISMPNHLAFSTWAVLSQVASGDMSLLTFTGAGAGSGSTGQKYDVELNSSMLLLGAVLPGTVAGTTALGGQVL